MERPQLLVELQDGFQCEAVIMSYDTTGKDPEAETGSKCATLCVSSQVGCQMGVHILRHWNNGFDCRFDSWRDYRAVGACKCSVFDTECCIYGGLKYMLMTSFLLL